MDDSRYYQPSGAVPIGGLFSAVTIAGTGALIGGFLYGVIGAYNPFIYVTFLGAMFVSALVGNWLHGRLVAGKIRSKAASVMVALLVAGTLIYGAWWGYICVQSEWDWLLVTPLGVLNFIELVANVGVWSIKGFTPTGGVLYLVWLIEAGLMTWFVISGALEVSPPFCEDCDEVTVEKISKHPIPVRIVDTLREELEAEQYEPLLEGVRGEPLASRFMTVTANMCPRCSESSYLLIQQVEVTPDKDGSSSTATRTAIPWIKLEARIVAALEAEIAKGPQPPEPEQLTEFIEGDSADDEPQAE